MNIRKIPPYIDDLVNVIIETPKGSVYKYDFDPDWELFQLNKTMPMGMIFPFDFGFIPNTKGADGDPLDVLVIMEEPAIQGSLVTCRLLGILEASQKEKGKEFRNDRIVAVSSCSLLYKDAYKLSDLGKEVLPGIEQFFIEYNARAGKDFKPIRWEDGTKALKLINRQMFVS